MKAQINWFIATLFIISLHSCKCKRALSDPAAEKRAFVAQMDSLPVAERPEEIWTYFYKEDSVFYVMEQCCDQMNTVYSLKGEKICHPDGGITGKGDGNCMDFRSQAVKGVLLYRFKAPIDRRFNQD